MAIKRTYNIPLRKEFRKAPNYKRSKKAMTGLITFLQKHMKSEDIKVGPKLNEKIWENGIKNPPHHVEVAVLKTDEGQVRAELVGFEKDFLEPRVEDIEDKKSSKTDVKEEKATKETVKAESIEEASSSKSSIEEAVKEASSSKTEKVVDEKSSSKTEKVEKKAPSKTVTKADDK